MKKHVLPIVLLTILLLKLWMISGNEIVSEGSDSIEYMLIAKAWFWGFPMEPIRGPGYPIYVALARLLHVPLRLTSELVFAAGSASFALSLLRLQLPRVAVAGVFFALLFHPLTILNLDMPMSEGLFTALSLASLGALVHLLTASTFRTQLAHGVLLGLYTVLMVHVRESDKNILFLLLVEAIVCLSVRELGRTRRSWQAFGVVGPILAPILVVNLMVFTANYFAFGHFGYNGISSDGALRLIHTMMTIDTGEPARHSRILVTTKARRIAYELNPTLLPYRTDLEGRYFELQQASSLATYSRTGVRGELDAEDTMGLLRQICGQFSNDPVRQRESAASCDKLLRKIADEIERGIGTHHVPTRTVLSVLNPAWKLTLPALGTALQRMSASFFHYADEPIRDHYPFYGTMFADLYNTMANRRARRVAKGPVQGFISVPAGEQVASVAFANDAIEFFREQTKDPSPFATAFKLLKDAGLKPYIELGDAAVTPDPAPPESMRPGDVYRFAVPPVKDRVYLHFTRLTIKAKSGKEWVVRDIDQGAVRTDVTQAVKVLATSFELRLNHSQKAGYAAQSALFGGFNTFAPSVAWVLAVGAGCAVLLRRRRPGMRAAVFLILASAVLMRLAFYAVVDVTIFPINLERHLFPASILVFPLLIIALGLAWERDAGADSSQRRHAAGRA